MSVLDEQGLKIAAFRHRVIAEAIEARDEQVSEILRRAALRPQIDPHGREVHVAVRTLWRWVSRYRRGGLVALCPRSRSDKGTLRAFEPKILEHASALRREKPQRSTSTLIDILVRKKLAEPGAIAPATLNRHLSRLAYRGSHSEGLGKKLSAKSKPPPPLSSS